MGKVGSSTMPQKRNPMICEAILSIARLTRQSAAVAGDSMYSEHERDWSTMQLGWSYLPQLCVMAHGALEMSVRVNDGLQVYPENMMRNLLSSHGLLLAERVMLALGKFIGRQHAHDIIYESAMKAFEQRLPFEDVLKQNASVTTHLDPQSITDLLDPVQYTGLSAVFVDRVLGEKSASG